MEKRVHSIVVERVALEVALAVKFIKTGVEAVVSEDAIATQEGED